MTRLHKLAFVASISLEAGTRRRSTDTKEDTSMANNMWTDNPYSKAFGEMNLSGLPMMAPAKEMAARYIDVSEQWANQALDMCKKNNSLGK